jgi:hypothetical protein
MHSKSYVSRKTRTTYNLEQRENGRSISVSQYCLNVYNLELNLKSKILEINAFIHWILLVT